ncbi:MAG: hypothetical protein IPJ18_19945 [Betaproteobacteria bacterium]|nr:hypothetical protein [Betaproteobacteria bacterium]
MGGYFVIEVASQEEALSGPARSPASSVGHTEVRPSCRLAALMDASQQAAVQAARATQTAACSPAWLTSGARHRSSRRRLAEAQLPRAHALAPRERPSSPEAWLTTAAKRNTPQAARHQRVVLTQRSPSCWNRTEARPTTPTTPPPSPTSACACAGLRPPPGDRRRCEHPSMLQVVLGLDAAKLLSALLLKPATWRSA